MLLLLLLTLAPLGEREEGRGGEERGEEEGRKKRKTCMCESRYTLKVNY